jgi:excinuclease UvrABC nuclease subunit
MQSGIYVLFAPNREVIYVGQVGSGEKRRLFGRLKQHTRDHLRDRWSHFSWFGLCEADPDTGELKAFESSVSKPPEILDELEAILIHLFEPRLNMQRAKWKVTAEYIQHTREDDENVNDDGEED